MSRPLVLGRCPACKSAGLYVAEGGAITCPNVGCWQPTAPQDVLDAVSVSDEFGLLLPGSDKAIELDEDSVARWRQDLGGVVVSRRRYQGRGDWRDEATKRPLPEIGTL